MAFLDSCVSHLRFALRGLGRDRAFTTTALLTFGVCLGANLALFALVNAVLLRPLPFPDSEQLVIVRNSYPKAGAEGVGVSVPHYLERRAGIAAFADAAAFRDDGHTIGDAGSPDRVDGMSVTPSFFSVLGAKAALGRTFTDEEGAVGQNNVVVLSDALWRQRFGGDPNIINKTLRLDSGWVCTIVGVMPPDFHYLKSKARLWTPLTFSDESRKPERRHSNNMLMIARLRPEVSLATAQAQVNAMNEAALASDPYAQLVKDAGFLSSVENLHAQTVASIKPALLLLQSGVVFLLLIGVVNLTNLLLVRASARAKDFSIRTVMGASQSALARQILAETLALASLGGLLGLGLGWAGIRGLAVLGADELPHTGTLSLDFTVAGIGLLATLVVGVLIALPVIWHHRGDHLAASLSVESRGGTTSRATHRLRHGLIIAQFALAFILLAGAGLLGLSFTRVLSVAPGFQPEHVLTAAIPLPRSNYKEDAQRIAFLQRLQTELTALPGVNQVAFGTALPFSGSTSINAVAIEGRALAPGESLQTHHMSGVSGDFFPALGIPLRSGRFLTANDSAREDHVCVIDEIMAKRYWPDGNALGARIYNGPADPKETPFTVVGVVGSVKQNDLADPRPLGAIYLPFRHYSSGYIFLGLRSTQAPELLTGALRSAVLRVDPELPIVDVSPLAHRLDESLSERRSPVVLAVIFAGVALLLAGVGLYGVLAYAVAQRRREIGVRMALGAQPSQIRGQFLGLGARLVAGGALLGLVGTWLAGQAMSKLLFGVTAMHPGVLAATAAALGALALLACVLPALRASRVPPMEALRG